MCLCECVMCVFGCVCVMCKCVWDSLFPQVAPNFPKECAGLPSELLELLSLHCEILDPSLRRTVVQCLILLCNRQMVSRLHLLPVFFRLFRVQDKQLRSLIFSHIVNDIKRLNKQTNQQKLNGALQNFMYSMLRDENRSVAKKSLDVMIDLWRRKVWRDAKTVNAIADMCFSPDSRMLSTALSFFLGVEDYDEEEEQEEEIGETYRKVGAASSMLKGTIKNTKKRKRELKRVVAKVSLLLSLSLSLSLLSFFCRFALVVSLAFRPFLRAARHLS